MIGSIISAGANIIGGLMGQSSASKAAEQQAAVARENIEMQKTFAKKGIRWKVEDAKAAGIHPVYALGAPTTSFSPISMSSTADNSLGRGIAAAGSDIGRAMNATRTGSERVDAYTQAAQQLSLEKGALENQLLASQIKRLESQSNPPMPAISADSSKPFPVPEDSKSEKRPPLMALGGRWMTNPNTSPMEAWEKQYGDDGPISWMLPLLLGINDLQHNVRQRIPSGGLFPGLARGLVSGRRGY